MKINVLTSAALLMTNLSFSQKNENVEKLKKELGNQACECVQQVDTYNKKTDIIAEEVNKCINDKTAAFQLGVQLMNIDLEDDKSKKKKNKETSQKNVEITVNIDPNSDEYKKSYYELERYMMENCEALKAKMAVNDKQHVKSMSKNSVAQEYHDKGVKEMEKENYKIAVSYFEKAVKEDSEFAFAWDNLGLIYRKLNELEKAITCYEKSLSIDP